MKISNGPLKFGNLHVFEWDVGHWPIIRAHHHFGLGLTLVVSTVSLSLSHWYPGSGVVLDCIDS